MSARSFKASKAKKRRRVTESVLPSETIEKLNSVLDRLATAPLDPDTVPVDPDLMALQSAKHKMENAKNDDDVKFLQARDAYIRLYEKMLGKSTVTATTNKTAATVNANANKNEVPVIVKQEQHEEEEEEEEKSERIVSDEDIYSTEGYDEDTDDTTTSLEELRNIMSPQFRCMTCGKEMASQAGLTKHMNAAHKQWQGKGGTPEGATRVAAQRYEYGEASKRN